MNRPTVLIVADEDTFGHKATLCLARAGMTVHAMSPRRSTALRWSRHITGIHRLAWDLLQEPGPEFVRRLEDVAAAVKADVIFPIDESPIQALASVADELTTPTVAIPSVAAFDTCNDKHRFARFCDQHGLAQPTTWHLIETPDALPNDIEYPVIAKPTLGGGGLGVVRIDSASALAEHMASGTSGSAPPLLVQDYIPGTDIDCSFLAESGRLVASAVQTRASMHDRTIRFVDRPDVVEVCAELAAALGYDGLAHVDLRIDERDDSVRLIEANPRVWGSVAYAMQAGINFPALAVDRVLHAGFEPPKPIEPLSVTNTPVRSGMIMRARLGRPAPADLSGPDAAAWEANAADPWPTVAVQARRVVHRLLERVRPANRTA